MARVEELDTKAFCEAVCDGDIPRTRTFLALPHVRKRINDALYALVDRPDVCRRLLERGATPDIFLAARHGDIGLATRLLDENPSCTAMRDISSHRGLTLAPSSVARR